MLIFSAQPILPPDEKILRIHQDIRNIIKIFTQPSDAKNYQDLVDETTDNQPTDTIDNLKDKFKVLKVNVTDFEEDEDKPQEKKDFGPDNEGLILITSLVTSCIRGLHHCTSKLYTLEILQLLCENSSSETILDRILPYIVSIFLIIIIVTYIRLTLYPRRYLRYSSETPKFVSYEEHC
jgi:phosphoinositide-3-kinase, regulatory subunit 4